MIGCRARPKSHASAHPTDMLRARAFATPLKTPAPPDLLWARIFRLPIASPAAQLSNRSPGGPKRKRSRSTSLRAQLNLLGWISKSPARSARFLPAYVTSASTRHRFRRTLQPRDIKGSNPSIVSNHPSRPRFLGRQRKTFARRSKICLMARGQVSGRFAPKISSAVSGSGLARAGRNIPRKIPTEMS